MSQEQDMSQEQEVDWRKKYEDLLKDYLDFIEAIDNSGFQLQGFAKNRRATLLNTPTIQQSQTPNRQERRRHERESEKVVEKEAVEKEK